MTSGHLRPVEDPPSPPRDPRPRGGNGNGGSDYGERLARIEAKMEHMATREDIASVRTLIAEVKTLIAEKETKTLRWLIGIIALAAISLLTVLIRTFLSTPS